MRMAISPNLRIRCRAFSYVELCMVMTIIAVFAAVAVLSYSHGTDGPGLQAAAQRLAADLSRVRDGARRARQSYTLSFDANQCRYQAVGLSGVLGPQDLSCALTDRPYQVDSMELQLSGQTQIQFDAYGKADPAGQIVLRRGRQQISVKINERGDIETSR
ncbi:MAG: GspH/FimT family pseudopilin [Sedimentisphaerales bacterium]|nr:GspH/FimT family pseudopilin [Sedimentisphaerales bacterium]